MARSHLEYRVARTLYEKHGVITFPCPDTVADLVTISGLRIEVKRGTKQGYHGSRHGQAPGGNFHLIAGFGDHSLSCALTESQRDGGFDVIVIVVEDEVWAFEWEDVADLIRQNKTMLYIPETYYVSLGNSSPKPQNLSLIEWVEDARRGVGERLEVENPRQGKAREV